MVVHCLSPENALMAMSNRDGFTVRDANDLVGIEPLGKAANRFSPHGLFHPANALVVEKSD
jgi:hypothetical protein